MQGVSYIALMGLNKATQKFEKSATNVVNAGTVTFENHQEKAATPLRPLQDQQTDFSNISIEREMVSMMQAEHAYKANAFVLSKADDLHDALINVLNEDA